MNLTNEERDFIYAVSKEIMGRSYEQLQRPEIIIANVRARIRKLNYHSFSDYLKLILNDETEFANFVSSLTIHTTTWFRETPHYLWFRCHLQSQLQKHPDLNVRILSAACATGEEVYSMAFLCESLRKVYPDFNYYILGVDVDPISIDYAKRAIYPQYGVQQISDEFQIDTRSGLAKVNQSRYQVVQEIRNRCQFQVVNIKKPFDESLTPFDIIFCRNVLIYFDNETVDRVVHNLYQVIRDNGFLVVGHSEAISPRNYHLATVRGTIYQRQQQNSASIHPASKGKRVMLVIQLTTLRSHLQRALSQEGHTVHVIDHKADLVAHAIKQQTDLIIADTVHNEAKMIDNFKQIQSQRPNTRWLFLDQDSDTTASRQATDNRLRQHPTLFRCQCFENTGIIIEWLKYGMTRAEPFIRARSHKPESFIANKRQQSMISAILVGASTGGPQVLSDMLQNLPPDYPPIVVVQHISGQFHAQFAARLASITGLKAPRPVSGMTLRNGHLYLAHDDYHLKVSLGNSGLILRIDDDPPLQGHRPSIDMLFGSAAKLNRATFLGVLLTGMGSDGAQGLHRLRQSGAITFCQDPKSAVVASMPLEALKLSPDHKVERPPQIRQQIDTLVQRQNRYKKDVFLL
jgi:chemotaxis response regulator CheB/chemotaxis methyl-accepting protein methylase